MEYYLSWGSGAELARSVLTLLRPRVAMDHCLRIYRDDPIQERRHSAIELLRAFGDQSTAEWIPEFLRDPDPVIQGYGASLVDYLVFAGLLDGKTEAELLQHLQDHPNPEVRRYVGLIVGSKSNS